MSLLYIKHLKFLSKFFSKLKKINLQLSFIFYFQGTKSPDVVEFMNKNYPPNFSYADFAKEFTTEFFDANEWANIIKSE